MKSRYLLPLLLILALCVPIAMAAAAPSGSDNAVSIAKKKKKKKLTWCQKKAKAKKGAKLFGKVSSAKFFLYVEKGKYGYFFCSESPKFTGGIGESDGIKKTSFLRAVKGKCAMFYSESKPGSGYDAGAKYFKAVAAQDFRRGGAKFTTASRVGTKDEVVSMRSVTLAKNCVYAAGYTLDGVVRMKIGGLGPFPFHAHPDAPIAGGVEADLKNIKIVATTADSATIRYTANGVEKTTVFSEANNKYVTNSW
jgi:hypothetical protein